MTHGLREVRPRRQRLRDAVVTLAVVLLAFAAFDDITTDTDTTFAFEWVALALCAVWLLTVSWRLVRTEHRWLGAMSLVAALAGVAAGSAVRPGVGPFEVESLTTVATLVWFLGLGGILAGQAWRRVHGHSLP